MKPHRDPPPFRWCLALTLLCLLYWLLLDLLARTERLGLHAFSFALNLSSMLYLVALAGVTLAGALWSLERILAGERSIRTGTATLVGLFVLLAYLNVLYFRLFLAINGYADIAKIYPLFPLLLVLALPLYRYRFGAEVEWLRDRGRRWATPVLRGFALLLLVATVILGTAALGKAAGKREIAGPARPHLLIVTCDALRAKSMSLYGYARQTTPNLDKLGQSSYVFDRFRATYACTQYGMPAFLGYCTTLDQSESDLLGELRQAGYESTFISYTSISPRFRNGFSHVLLSQTQLNNPVMRGIREHISLDAASWLVSFLSEPSFFFNIASPYNPVIVDFGERLPPGDSLRVALDVLTQAEQPSLVWVHLFQPHSPYDISPQPIFGPGKPDRYDSAIHNADAGIGALVEALRRQGLWDSVMLVVSADHGETVGETQRGQEVFGHRADWVNEWVAETPLLIHKPGQTAGARVATFAYQLDLAPTLLQLLGLPWQPRGDGLSESLLPYIEAPGALSPKVKVCLPDSHLMRRSRAVSPTENKLGWLAPNREDMIAYCERYEVRWSQTYPIEGQTVGRTPDSVVYTAIYDVLADPGRRRNLYQPGDSLSDRVIAKVGDDPLIKAAQTGTGNQSP